MAVNMVRKILNRLCNWLKEESVLLKMTSICSFPIFSPLIIFNEPIRPDQPGHQTLKKHVAAYDIFIICPLSVRQNRCLFCKLCFILYREQQIRFNARNYTILNKNNFISTRVLKNNSSNSSINRCATQKYVRPTSDIKTVSLLSKKNE